MTSQLSKEQAEEEILELLSKHCPPGVCPLVGYSVQCDREVLKVEMPKVYRFVSHKIVDVSGFFKLGRLWLPEKMRLWDRRRHTRLLHRAASDVDDSIEALRWVRSQLFQQPGL